VYSPFSTAGAWSDVCHELRAAFPAEVEATDHFLPYAVTAPQVQKAAEALGVSRERTYETLARHGCVGCAGPLISLDHLQREGRAAAGQTLTLAAVAGGISRAALIWQL
jgi:3-oxoacyl-[acyl-carrier-protein] synthase III